MKHIGSVLPLGSSETSLISHRRARNFVALLEVEFEKALSPSAHRPSSRPSQWLEPLEEAVPCEERGECSELEGEVERDGLLLLNLF